MHRTQRRADEPDGAGRLVAVTSSQRDEREALLRRLAAAGPQVATNSILLHQTVADRFGLHVTDLRCLQRLAEQGVATAGELAAATGLTTGAVTRMIDRLERAGYVHRAHGKEDRRQVLIRPDEQRTAEIGGMYADLSSAWQALWHGYSDEQLRLFVEMFDRMHILSQSQIATLSGDLPRDDHAEKETYEHREHT